MKSRAEAVIHFKEIMDLFHEDQIIQMGMGQN
jgi:hypothetical protein